MYRIREKPLSAKSSRSPAIHKLPEENIWNDNVRGQVLQNYDPKSDKHCLGFFNMRKTYKKQRLKQLNSIRSNNSSSKESRSASAHKNDLTTEQIEILKEELELTWKNFKIPEQHKKLFNFSIANAPKMQAAVKIAREIDSVEKGNSNITAVIQAVTAREELLAEIAARLKENTAKVDVNGFVKAIEKLRDVTLRAIECTYIWKSGFFAETEFEWEGGKYFAKLRHDTDFFSDSFLHRFFHFYKSDPLFTGPVNTKTYNKREFSIPFGYRQSLRIKKAMEIINFFPVKPIKIRSEAQITEAPVSVTEQFISETPQLFNAEISQVESDNKKELPEICRNIFEELLEADIISRLDLFVVESFKEIIAASLTLYSSSILDRVITEVLSELIPAIAKESHTEVTDSEYIDIRNLIINEVMEEQIAYISNIQTNTVLSLYITEEVVGCIELFQITLQTIQEEMKENQSIVYIVVDELIEEFIREDWVEDIAEIELVQEKMEYVWIDLPAHIQKEIYTHQKHRIIERLIEMVYFGILNDIIGRLWLENLVKSIVKECQENIETPDEEVFVLKDPNVVLDDMKKSILFRNIRKK